MSYNAQKISVGKSPSIFMEIILDRCVNQYGVAPCLAAGPDRGKCFNCLGTCQDRNNFNADLANPSRQVWRFRFATDRLHNLQQPGDAPTFPTLMSCDTTPTKLEPGNGLGIRSSVRLDVMDHPWTDRGCDPYLDGRNAPFVVLLTEGGDYLTTEDGLFHLSEGDPAVPGSDIYDPDSQGSFWGKLLARHFNYEGRVCNVYTGFLDDNGDYDAANFLKRSYLLTRISGPDSKGKVSIEAKDPLKYADNEKVQLPAPTKMTLKSDITNATTSFVVLDPDGELPLVGYPVWCRMEDEVVNVTNVVAGPLLGEKTVTVLRAKLPTFYEADEVIAVEHKADSAFQPCFLYEDERIDDVFYDLLVNRAGVPAAYIPFVDWQDLVDQQFSGYRVSTLLTEPTGIKTLLVELTEHNIWIWWDERAQLIKMDGLYPRGKPDDTYNDSDHIVADSVSISKDIKNRISRVIVCFGARSPLLDLKKYTTFRTVSVVADLDKETPEEYGSAGIKTIYSRWLPTTQPSTAVEIRNRLLDQYKDTLTVLSFTMDSKDDNGQWTGDVISLQTRQLQDIYGAPVITGVYLIEVDEVVKPGSVRYVYTGLTVPVLPRGNLGISPDEDQETPPDPFPDYPAASAAERQWYFICADTPPYFADNTAAYVITN